MSAERYLEKISVLEKELNTRNNEIHRAALYGKQLLDDNKQLKSQIETLKQENHSLHVKLDAKSKANESNLLELECQKDAITVNEDEIQCLKKEYHIMNKKFQEKSLQAEEMKKVSDDLFVANNTYKEKISELENELKTYREQVQISLNETNGEEYQRISLELQACQEEKMALLSRVTETDLKLDKLKSQEEKYISLIESLKQSLEERDYEIQSYSIMVQKTREEMSELLGQIELMKLEQVDVNRKGNSVFSEVEDRRKLVEKELVVLKKKHEALQENYNVRLSELRKVKHQLSIFLGMFSQKVDYNYMEDLENSLRGAKKEIEYLTKRLDEQINSHTNFISTPVIDKVIQPGNQYNYFRALLAQAQKRNEELEKELQSLRMSKLAESDELIQTKQLLYRSQTTCENLKGEVLQLKLKLQDLLMRPGDEKQDVEPKKEIIPGFKPLEQRVESSSKWNKLKEMKSGKKVNSKGNWDFDKALKNQLSSKAKKNIFNNVSEGNSYIDNNLAEMIQSPCTPMEKSTAPSVVMNDGKDGCNQQ